MHARKTALERSATIIRSQEVHDPRSTNSWKKGLHTISFPFRVDRTEVCYLFSELMNYPQAGGTRPQWPGTVDTLDGTVSCSVVIDPDVVRRDFASTPPGQEPDLIPA